jgi:AraC-like DNA-binding protein
MDEIDQCRIAWYTCGMRFYQFATAQTTATLHHRHQSFEFHFIISGDGAFFRDNRRESFRAGDFIFSFPNEAHHIVCKKGEPIMQTRFYADAEPGDQTLITDLARISRERRVLPAGERTQLFFERLRVYAESHNRLLWKSATHAFAAFLYEEVTARRETAGGGSSALDIALARLHAPFTERCSLSDVARIAGMSRSYFIRFFRKQLGIPPMQYRMRMRIESAALNLIETDHSIGEIAAMAGFDDALYFSRMFRRWMGVPPSSYRARVR